MVIPQFDTRNDLPYTGITMTKRYTTNRDCTVSWCQNKEYARGLCGTHYNAMLQGRPFINWAEKRKQPKPKCQGPECDRDASTAGLCNSHYMQQWTGRELKPLRPRFIETDGDLRKCKTCEQFLPAEESFYKTTRGNYQGECKSCLIERSKRNQRARAGL